MVATHYDAVRAISSDFYSSEILGSWSPAPDAGRIEWLASVIDSIGTHCLIAEVPETGVAGFAILVIDESVLQALYVLPKHECQGIGASLLSRMEDHARKLGMEKLCLEASINSASFYKGKGFREVGESTQQLGDGQLMASISMEKQLHENA
jgi:GNAT superfamily N-acetyltransferase